MGKSDEGLYIGIDLGGTNIQAGVVDGTGKVRSRRKNKTRSEEGFEPVVDRIAQTVTEAIEKAKVSPGDVEAVCVGAPGTLDIANGTVLTAPNLRWNHEPLGPELEKRLGMPVSLDNDVNVGTWGEAVAGAGKGYDDLLGVFVGTGIGAGLVLGGRLYHGHFHTAGEIGHTILDPDAGIGRRTLENRASRTAVVNQLIALIKANHQSAITEITKGDITSIRSKVIAAAVKQEDPLTMAVLEQAAKEVAAAIANIVTMLSLPCVVVGGGVTEAVGRRWMDWVRHYFKTFVFPPELARCRVVSAKLKDDAGVVGAALLAKSRSESRSS